MIQAVDFGEVLDVRLYVDRRSRTDFEYSVGVRTQNYAGILFVLKTPKFEEAVAVVSNYQNEILKSTFDKEMMTE